VGSQKQRKQRSIGELFNDLFFNTLKLLGVSILKIFFSFKTKNCHFVPAKGPFIITANHFSFMDPPVLQAACPRRIIFLMTEKYYNPIWFRWFFKSMHCIPLRDETPYNIGPLKKGLKVLKEGKVIGIFPEGGVSPNGIIREGMAGTLLLAQKSNAPIIPAYISGTYQALPRQAKFFRKAKIKVIFGNPVTFSELSEGLKGKEGLQKGIENLMQQIRELAPNQNGAPDRKK
jgi:1-acyl-sn-glycerol-3-phosphate acyltransferase